jgi:mono/diheme cytochrome c family protein
LLPLWSANDGDDRKREDRIMKYRLIGLSGAAVLAAGGALAASWSQSASPVTPVAGPPAAMTKECGACHMVFPPQLLPARSWVALMDGLGDHFGETATLDAAAAKDIKDYLVAHAADTAGGERHALRGLSASDTPLRITDTPAWIREHNSREVSPAAFASPKVKSKSNCVACHANAAKGVFEDDD